MATDSTTPMETETPNTSGTAPEAAAAALLGKRVRESAVDPREAGAAPVDMTKVFSGELLEDLKKMKTDEERSEHMARLLTNTQSRLKQADELVSNADEMREKLAMYEERDRTEFEAWQTQQEPLFDSDWKYAEKNGLLPEENDEAREKRCAFLREAYLSKDGGIVADNLKQAVTRDRALMKEKRDLERTNKELSCAMEDAHARQAGFRASNYGLLNDSEQRAMLVQNSRRAQEQSARSFYDSVSDQPEPKRRRYHDFNSDADTSFAGAALPSSRSGPKYAQDTASSLDEPRQSLTHTTSSSSTFFTEDMMKAYGKDRDLHPSFASNPFVASLIESASTRVAARNSCGLPPGVDRELYKKLAENAKANPLFQ